MKLPRISGKEIIYILVKEGLIVKRQKGSHVTLYKKTTRGLYVIVPVHSNQDIALGTLLSIIRQAGMSKKQFTELI